jgi:hypothetical protein
MSQKLNSAIAVIGIDIGKNSFHIVGQDQRGAIVLRQKWSRGEVQARAFVDAFAVCGHRSLELDLGAKAVEIPVNDSDGQFYAGTQIRYRAVSRIELPVDLGFIPSFGVPDISDAKIVLLGPEERDGVKYFPAAKNVACRGLSLTLGHDKVLDAYSFAGEPVRPARDVAGCEDARDARLEVFVHGDAAINGEPCLFHQRGSR